MGGQTVYQNQLRGYPGQRHGLGHKARSLVNDTGAVRQVDTFEVTANVDGQAYTITFSAPSGLPSISVTAPVGSTIVGIRDALLEKARSFAEFEGLIAFNPSGSAKLLLTAIQAGTGWTSAESSANFTRTATTANVATISIPWGRAVVVGASADDQSAKLPTATGQKFRGVADRLPSTSDPSAADAGNQGKVAPFMEFSAVYEGQILVEVDMAVAVGDPVYFRHTTAGGGADDVGTFRKDADTNKADAITGAVFETSTSGAGLAVISLQA